MQYALAVAGLAVSVSGAAVLTERQADKCCFGINVSGNGVNGALGQLSDGQNRVGPAQSPNPAQYCISGGTITDGSGRGCILTAPTTQFQCDQGASPSPGFAVGPNGQITHNGDSKFYACPADDKGDYNIYTQPVANMPKCVEVSLSSAMGACAAPAPSSSKAPVVSTKIETTPVPVVSTKIKSSPVPVPTTKLETTPVPVVSTEIETSPVPVVTTKFETSPVPVVSKETITKTEVSTSQCPAPPAPVTMTSTYTEKQTMTNVITSTVQSQCPAPQTVTVTSVNTVVPPPVVKTSVVTPQPSVNTVVPAPTTVVVQTTVNKPSPSASPSAPSGGNGLGNGKCPLNLPDMSAYQYPHLIVPVDSKSPNTPGGTSYNGKVSSSTSSIFNFDIPASYAGKTCKVVFSLPTASQLTTSSFTSMPANGGALDVSSLKSPASKDTSSANKPAVAGDLGKLDVAPGNAYTVASGPCAAGTTQSYEISSVNGYSLEWFQDYNPCPIGLYVTTA